MKYTLMLLAGFFISNTVLALDVKLTSSQDYVEVVSQGNLIRVQRIQDQDHVLDGGFSKTSRKCPPFCIQPMSAGEGVTTVGQLELFAFMEEDLLDESGVIIDARTPSWYSRGTIPGSVNIPFTIFSLNPNDEKLINAMQTLGAKRRYETGVFEQIIEALGFMSGDQKTDTWDFTAAKDLILWCNGPWCGQSPRAISGLLKIGYPASKINYYRGGMQVWQSLGLTVTVP
jgi:rhodanese-related sulfurtransferase